MTHFLDSLPSAPPALDEACVWMFPLSATEDQLRLYRAWLSRAEHVRAERFVTDQLRNEWIVCRGSLRALVAKLAGMEPSQVEFAYGRWGKPWVSSSAPFPMHVNVSHSGGWGCIALANNPLGVDIEIPTRKINVRGIASQVVSPREQNAWAQIPAAKQTQALMRLWVSKEALLKALGLGIAEGLKQTAFELPLEFNASYQPEHIDAGLQLHLEEDGTCSRTGWLSADQWRLHPLDVPEGHPGVVAVHRGVKRISQQICT